jgi:hypothetical protein
MVKYSHYHKNTKQWIDCEVISYSPTIVEYKCPVDKIRVQEIVEPSTVKTLQYFGEDMS